MRSLAAVLSVALLLAGCAASGPGAAGRDASGRAPALALRDTARYDTFCCGGTYALLYRGGQFVDTVDVAFGVHRIGTDSLLFLPVSQSGGDPRETWFSLGEHVLYTSGRRVLLGERLPYFDDHFSSPSVIGGALYYWGIAPERRLYAMRYDFDTARVDSGALGETTVGTDFRFYRRPPRRSGNAVIYRSGQGRWRVGMDEFEVERLKGAGTSK